MASHIPLVENGSLIGLDGKPLAPLPVNAWAGLPFESHPHMRRSEVAHRYNPHALLLVHLRAHGRARIRSGRQVFDLAIAPGQVDVFPPGFQMDEGWWDCTPGEVLAVELDPEKLVDYLHDDASRLDVSMELAARDEVLDHLATCIRAEVDGGCYSGAPFAEGMSIALLSLLFARYGAGERPRRMRNALSERQVRQIIEFIDANLSCSLSVQRLAAQISMSPYTFTRLFKASVNATPHQFVTSRRIQRAEVLFAGDLPLSEIALAVGFASQSHFNEVYRRRTGRTPSKVRRDATRADGPA